MTADRDAWELDLTAEPGGRAGGDLNATVVAWGPGEGVPEHANAEVDVLVVVVAGAGTAVVDGVEHSLRPLRALMIPRGSRRAIAAGPGGLRYLTVHRRRGLLQIDQAP